MKTLILGTLIGGSIAMSTMSSSHGLAKKLTENLSMIQSHAHNHNNHNSSDSSHNGLFDFNF